MTPQEALRRSVKALVVSLCNLAAAIAGLWLIGTSAGDLLLFARDCLFAPPKAVPWPAAYQTILGSVLFVGAMVWMDTTTHPAQKSSRSDVTPEGMLR